MRAFFVRQSSSSSAVEQYLKVSNAELFLKDIRSISSSSQCTQRRQVTAVTSHRLDNKHTILGARRRLLDAINNLQLAERTIRPACHLLKFSPSFLFPHNILTYIFHFC